MKKRSNGWGLILFVHGLAGSHLGTWGDMLKVVASNIDLSDYAFDCYSFPTSLLRFPFFGRRAGIRELSEGLDTYLKSFYSHQKNILLVGHSLGGIIARFYVLEQVRAHDASFIKGLALYAVPNTGAGIASAASSISWRHRHLSQLCKGSDFLDELNVEWVRQSVEQQVRTLYIIGSADAIVSRESGFPYVGGKNIRTIVEHGHRAIVKPSDADDLRYKILKDFALSVFPIPIVQESNCDLQNAHTSTARKSADPLFDVYTTAVEEFYVIRETDKTLRDAGLSTHLWISGPSGVGKTAALKRLIDQSGWRFQHIMLASLRGLNGLQLFQQICSYLYERAGLEEKFLVKSNDINEILKHIRTVLPAIPGSGTIAIFVEEIPLSLGPEYSDFLEAVYHITNDVETLALPFRVIWIFSSIYNPKAYIGFNRPKFLEKVQFIELERWSIIETKRLLDLILEKVTINLTCDEQDQLIASADGLPRYVKVALRMRRSEVGAKMPINKLLESVATDLYTNE